MCALWAGCGAPPTLSQREDVVTVDQASELEQRRHPTLSAPVIIAPPELMTCEPPRDGQRLPPFTQLIDPEGLKSALEDAGGLDQAGAALRWLAWALSQRVELAFAYQRAPSPETRARHRAALDRLVTRLSREAGGTTLPPPLRVYSIATELSSAQSQSEDQSRSRAGWINLNTLDASLTHWAPRPQSLKAPQGVSEPKREPKRGSPMSESDLCADTYTRLVELGREITAVTPSGPAPLSQALDEALTPGVRLLKAPRPPISAACAELFELSDDHVSRDLPELGAQVPRWHVVIKTLARSTVTGERDHEGDGSAYLTLPLPAPPHQLPTLDLKAAESALARVWRKRALWWGAQGCWRRVSPDEISAPLEGVESRWVDLRFDPKRPQRDEIVGRRVLNMRRWLAPRGPIQLIDARLTLEREAERGLSADTRGVIASLYPPRVPIPMRAQARRLIGVWRRGELRAWASLSVASLSAYEALAQLSGERALYELALAPYSSIGPLLYVPREPQDAPPGWTLEARELKRALSLIGPSSGLHEGDLISVDASVVDARWLLGEPSVFSRDAHGLLKERLSRFIKSEQAKANTTSISSGSVLTRRGGPWLGDQRHRVITPLSALPTH